MRCGLGVGTRGAGARERDDLVFAVHLIPAVLEGIRRQAHPHPQLSKPVAPAIPTLPDPGRSGPGLSAFSVWCASAPRMMLQRRPASLPSARARSSPCLVRRPLPGRPRHIQHFRIHTHGGQPVNLLQETPACRDPAGPARLPPRRLRIVRHPADHPGPVSASRSL